MAADNNQQSASATETLAETEGDASGQATSVRKFSRPRGSRKNLLYALLILILLISAALVIKEVFHVGDKVYATAAGHNIYKDDIDNLKGDTKGVTDRQATVVLANKYLSEAMAKKAGVKVTDKDIVAQYGTDVNKQKNTQKFAYQSKVNDVYFNKLIAYNAGLYQGQVLVANFSRHIAFESPFLDIQKASDPLMGNAAAVAADKKYAKDFITKLYNQVKSKKLTFDQAIQAEHKDPVLGEQAYQTLPHSGAFDTANIYLAPNALLAPKSILAKIQNMKAGELSAPFVVSVNNSLTEKDKTTDSYYLVVKMDSTTGGNTGMTYDQYLAQSKKQLGYKIYD